MAPESGCVFFDLGIHQTVEVTSQLVTYPIVVVHSQCQLPLRPGQNAGVVQQVLADSTETLELPVGGTLF